MILDTKQYAGLCACGEQHRVATRLAVVEAGCLAGFDAYTNEHGLCGRRAAIYDENTYEAKGLHRPAAQQEIILPAKDLCANERAVSLLLQTLKADTEVLVAVGGGTVHDIVRYCAHKLGLPFIACPTAASTDGYASAVCDMTWHGIRKVLPGVAPSLVLADVDVLTQAPKRLTRAGLGEAMSKFTALTDWRIAERLTGEAHCPVAEAMTLQAAVVAHGCGARLAKNDPGAVAQLMYGLLLSGLAMQMASSSRLAMGAEHHLASLMDLQPAAFGVAEPLLAGEKAVVSMLTVAALYKHLAQIGDITPYLKAYKPLDRAWFMRHFGEPAGPALAVENTPDALESVDPSRLAAIWESIRRIIQEMPDASELTSVLKRAGIKTTLKELGISNAKVNKMLQLAPCMQNDLTLLRMLRMLKFRYDSSDAASRAPSRSRRYADKAITRAGSSSAVSASSMR